jgi:putative AlgH/UPF0301 family transcriptional regulator
MAVPSAANSLLIRRLYRSLLKASRPFDAGTPSSAALTCLIHRSGIEDHIWEPDAPGLPERGVDEDDSNDEDHPPMEANHQLFRRILREFVSTGSGIRQMRFPSQLVQTVRMEDLIRREFKGHNGSGTHSISFSLDTRRQVAFMALREINKKLAWASRRGGKAVKPHLSQSACSVSPMQRPSEYLQSGTFLISHPLLTDYFRRTVVCILDHQEGNGDYGAYGLVVNRSCLSLESGRNTTLADVVQPLPADLASAFGFFPVKEGGPVHMSLQMLHADPALPPSENDECSQIGGTLLPMTSKDDESTALLSDRGIYYKGDVTKAANAVSSGRLDREDVSFFVGASLWLPGQLESEIERGFWLPCRGSPEIALSGICQHEPLEKGEHRPKADLWLSMLSACGEGEAELANLLWSAEEDELGAPCDDV